MFSPMTFDEQIVQLRMELDPRSPKLRLSVMAYLLEHGIKPEENAEDFISLLETIMKYVGAGLDELIKELQETQPKAETAVLFDPNSQTQNDDDPFGIGSAYL